MRWMRLRMIAVLAVAWLVGPAPLIAADQPTGDSKALPFKVLAVGSAPGQQSAGFFFARDEKTLEQIWSDLHLDSRIPKVNFNRRMVVAWVGGGVACDGYKLVHVREYANEVSLEIEHSHPKPHQMCMAIYSPTHLVAAIAQTTKPIKFTLTEVPRT